MKSKWVRYYKYLKPYWKLQTLAIGLGFFAAPLALVNPYLAKLIVDNISGNKDIKFFAVIVAAAASFFIINTLLTSFTDYLLSRINKSVLSDITKDLFKHLQGLTINFYNNHPTAELMYRLTRDITLVSDFICNTVPKMVTLLPRLFFIMAVVFYLNWRMAAWTLFLVPAIYLYLFFFVPRLKEMTQKYAGFLQLVYRGIHEAFSHSHLVKALGREEHEILSLERNLKKKLDFELKYIKVTKLETFFESLFSKAVAGIVILYGGYLVIKGRMSIGSLTAVMIYLVQLVNLFKILGRLYQEFNINGVARKRIDDIFSRRSDIEEAEDAHPLVIDRGSIEFKNVSFAYKAKRPVLENMSCYIKPGSRVALVGPSGCGKTTIFYLILRLYQQSEGEILIDGFDIKKVRQNSLKTGIGIVLQQPLLWNDTIANNIAYGKEDPTKKEIEKAAKLACADDFIKRLPKGYDSVMGEMACNISEGQKQRIALARTFIKRPKILMLDEAMASLDSGTEDVIIENIKREFVDSTIIIVTHRLAAAKKMDHIYFLDGPRRMISGSHDDLLADNKEYGELFASQIELASEPLRI